MWGWLQRIWAPIRFGRLPGCNEQVLKLGTDVLIDGFEIYITEMLSECPAFERKVMHHCTNDTFREPSLLELSRAEEISSHYDRVVGIASELEATSNCIGDRTLS